MLTFKDGPAAGQSLSLKRAPRFLRITQRRFALGIEHDGEEFDGLDQPGDVAKPDEMLHAYETEKLIGRAHMRFSGKSKGASGIYDIAEYTYVQPQPDDATMRDNAKWADWCESKGWRKAPPLV